MKAKQTNGVLHSTSAPGFLLFQLHQLKGWGSRLLLLPFLLFYPPFFSFSFFPLTGAARSQGVCVCVCVCVCVKFLTLSCACHPLFVPFLLPRRRRKKRERDLFSASNACPYHTHTHTHALSVSCPLSFTPLPFLSQVEQKSFAPFPPTFPLFFPFPLPPSLLWLYLLFPQPLTIKTLPPSLPPSVPPSLPPSSLRPFSLLLST